jgi:hypothetical protein
MWNHDDLIFEKLEKILVQTTKTNWRVNRLEVDVDKHWKEISAINKRIYIAMWWLSILSVFWEKILESFSK